MPRTLRNIYTTIFKGTITYYREFVGGMTVGEAKAILWILGKYGLDEIWFAVQKPISISTRHKSIVKDGKGVYWRKTTFNQSTTANKCKLKDVQFLIHFYGGPPNHYGYHMGTLATFACDRILHCCIQRGKTEVMQCVMQTLARFRGGRKQ